MKAIIADRGLSWDFADISETATEPRSTEALSQIRQAGRELAHALLKDPNLGRDVGRRSQSSVDMRSPFVSFVSGEHTAGERALGL